MPPPDIDGLSTPELKALVVELFGRVSDLSRTVIAQREEIARLKGLKGRPDIKPSKPSGMAKANPSKPWTPPRRGGGPKTAKRVIHEDRVVKASVPPGSRFKGYEDFVVQDLVLRPHVVRYRRERWLTPDGHTVVAPLPCGVNGHFGGELRRFVMVQHHQGQVTVARLLAQLRSIGLDVSKRQVMRMLIDNQQGFVAEARDVLRAGLETAAWITVDGPAGTGEAAARVIRASMASAPRSATTISPGSARPAPRAASTFLSCCAPAMTTMS